MALQPKKQLKTGIDELNASLAVLPTGSATQTKSGSVKQSKSTTVSSAAAEQVNSGSAKQSKYTSSNRKNTGSASQSNSGSNRRSTTVSTQQPSVSPDEHNTSPEKQNVAFFVEVSDKKAAKQSGRPPKGSSDPIQLHNRHGDLSMECDDSSEHTATPPQSGSLSPVRHPSHHV
jgi:hypothetical protein